MPRFTAPLTTVVAFGAILMSSVAVQAQSLNDRMKEIRRQQQASEAEKERRTRVLLETGIGTVNLQDVSAREAFEWVSTVSGLSVIVNWNKLEAYGIDPDQTINLSGRGMTIAQALKLIVMQIGVDGSEIVLDVTPWYVQVLTKEQANRDQVVIVYPIGDLLHSIPSFDDAPEFDLSALLSTEAGGGELFADTSESEPKISKTEQAEQIMTLIRETVEPSVWRQNGGTGGAITYWNENLIIRAPRYVHEQIGGGRSGRVATGGLGGVSAKPQAAGEDRLARAMREAERGTGLKTFHEESRTTSIPVVNLPIKHVDQHQCLKRSHTLIILHTLN